MTRAKVTLTVIKDTCLGYELFRGFAPAGDLVKASWIDFHDPDSNPEGYQREFDENRSIQAAEYANTVEAAFWPECIFGMRDNAEVDDDEEKVDFQFTAIDGTEGQFGTLEISYNGAGSAVINNKTVSWRRALSQVDCQHRLGSLADSSRPVTFCIFPRLLRREEAIIFKTINARQRKISTSLVDAIIQLTDPNAPVHIKWAWALGKDPGSPFNRRVWTGGRGRPTGTLLINLVGLRESLQLLVPRRYLRNEDPELWYVFIRNFWNVVKDLWPNEFVDRVAYKLQTTPGQGGLARFGQHIFRKVLPTQDIGRSRISAAFQNDGSKIDWRVAGPFKLATGKGGQREVYAELVKQYGVPN